MNIEYILFPGAQTYSTCHMYLGVPCLTFGPESSNVILIFHGNGEDAKNYEDTAVYFVSKGYHVVVIEYPGYGGNIKSPGSKTSEMVKNYVKHLAREIKKKYIHLYIIGISIGTGPATLLAKYLASYSGLQYLYLISPYYSIMQLVADRLGCLSYLVSDPFPTYKYIVDVLCKIHIYHGSFDQVIGVEHTKKLKQLNCNCTISIYNNDHNTMMIDALPDILIRVGESLR